MKKIWKTMGIVLLMISLLGQNVFPVMAENVTVTQFLTLEELEKQRLEEQARNFVREFFEQKRLVETRCVKYYGGETMTYEDYKAYFKEYLEDGKSNEFFYLYNYPSIIFEACYSYKYNVDIDIREITLTGQEAHIKVYEQIETFYKNGGSGSVGQIYDVTYDLAKQAIIAVICPNDMGWNFLYKDFMAGGT